MSNQGIGQADIVGTGGAVLSNNTPIDEDRYEDIKGSPYLFEEFVSGTLYQTNKDFIKDLKINYNGFSGSFEFEKDGKHYELDNEFYVKLEVVTDKFSKDRSDNMSDTTVFLRGLNPDDYTRFYMMVEGGENATIFKEFDVYESKRKIENVGLTIDVKNFGSQFLYYAVQGSTPKVFKLKSKTVLKTLGDKRLELYTKNKGLKLDNEKDLRQLVKYYNSLN